MLSVVARSHGVEASRDAGSFDSALARDAQDERCGVYLSLDSATVAARLRTDGELTCPSTLRWRATLRTNGEVYLSLDSATVATRLKTTVNFSCRSTLHGRYAVYDERWFC